MEIKNVLVIGAGVMGRQIALLAAMYGYSTVLYDAFADALESAEDWNGNYLEGRIAKGKLTAEAATAAKGNLRYEKELPAAAEAADIAIEAIIEKLDVKQTLFRQLDELCKPDTLIVSNSSFITSSQLAGCTKRPGKIANLHFFNPALAMKLVEVVRGDETEEEVLELLLSFSESLGKKPILIQRAIDGFVANRLIRAVTEEALFLVQEGYVTPQEIDIAAENGLNWPMGPYRLMDMTGIDISYLMRMRRYDESGDEKDKPPEFLAEKYRKGEYGRKTSKGWYDYSK